MSRVTPAAVLTLLACASPALLQAQGFEGVVTWQIHSDKGAMEMTQSYKGGLVRSDVAAQGHSAVMIMDASNATMTTIMPEQKMYMTMDLKKMAGQMQGMHPDDPSKPHTPPKITDEGTKATVAGRTCENYLMGDKQDLEMCVAKGMGIFSMGSPGGPMGGPGQMGGGASAAAAIAANPEYAKLFKEGFFPLRVSKVDGAKREVVMEATKVEPKPLDASLFKVPDGYTEMKLPGMHQAP